MRSKMVISCSSTSRSPWSQANWNANMTWSDRRRRRCGCASWSGTGSRISITTFRAWQPILLRLDSTSPGQSRPAETLEGGIRSSSVDARCKALGTSVSSRVRVASCAAIKARCPVLRCVRSHGLLAAGFFPVFAFLGSGAICQFTSSMVRRTALACSGVASFSPSHVTQS